MIIWIDGTYGVGKTKVALEIQKQFEGVIEFLESDFYYIEMIHENPFLIMGGTLPQNNMNFIKRFRNIIEEKTKNLSTNVLIDMSLTQRECKKEIFDYILSLQRNVLHIILSANEETIKSRIENDVEREKDLALSFLKINTAFLNDNFKDAIRINTNNRSVCDIAEEIIGIVKRVKKL